MRHERPGKHPIPKLQDGDFLHGHPPSLWGIVPLKTPIDQAREILATKGVLEACREYRYPETGATGIACWPYFNLNYEREVVKFVEFIPSIDITVAMTIEARGLPEAVLSAYTDFPDGHTYTLFILYFDAIWTSVTLVEQVPRIYTVTAGTRVVHVSYSKPPRAVLESPQRVPWKGYGGYPATDATSG